MKTKSFAIFFSVLMLSMSLTSVLPLPASNDYLLTSMQQQIINDLAEEEKKVAFTEDNVELLNLDWFNYMNSTFTKYKTIKVIDVYTLTEYYVQRLGGYNHADVQTIDAKNTAIFKKIYGGSWSWNRRPVWVEINGKYYAGSSNGMPHGFDILETGEGGHTCIHFLNSKTHGSKKVDPEHQRCVKYALEQKNLLLKYLNQN